MVGDRGIELRQVGRASIDVPWTSIGLLRVEEVDDGSARRKALCAHLSDGRRLLLPAPRSGREDGVLFAAQSAEILKAWRASYVRRGSEPWDAVPVDYRRAIARDIDLADTTDAVPAPPTDGCGSGEGGIYRSGLSRVAIHAEGISVARPTQRRIFIPWPAVRSVLAYDAGRRNLWVLRVRLHDRRTVLLPAPLSRNGEHDPDFQRALAEITAAGRLHQPPGADSRPSDRVSKTMLREAAGSVQLGESFWSRFR